MQKKGLIVLAGMLVLTAIFSWAATSWQLQTKLSSNGGTITVRNNPPQTGSGSLVFTNFTTSAPVPVVVAAGAGYKISTLSRNGSSVPILANMTTHYSTSYSKSGGSPQTLIASFAVKQIAVTAQASGPGSVSPASSQVAYNGSLTLTATPSFSNGVVTALAVNGVPYQVSLPYPGTLTFTLNNIIAPTSVTASFDTVTVGVGADQAVAVNMPVTLSGSMSGGATISWSEVSGPAQVNTAGWSTLTPSFTPTVPGNYSFMLSASVGGKTLATATTNVTVASSLLDYLKAACMGCHGVGGVLPANYTYTGWSSSGHKAAGVNCITCHTSGPMPTPVNSGTVDKTTFVVSWSGAGVVGAVYCVNCHTPGAVHKTAGMLCSTCHGSAASHDLDTTFNAALNVCFSCHGAVNTTHFYSKASLASTQCAFCHNQSGHAPQPRPAVTTQHFNGYSSPVNPSYAAAYVTPGSSCADCHQGGDPSSAGDGALLTYRQQWAASGHGDVKGAAFLNSAQHNWQASGTAGANAKQSASVALDCQRCHTKAGYLAFALYTSLAPVDASAPRYSEPLSCRACHTSGDFSAPLAIGPRTGYYNYSSAPTGRLQVTQGYPDAGRSNLCLGCHVGRQAGSTLAAIAQATAQKGYSSSFWQDAGFIDAHGLSAGGQLYGVTGYQYPGVDYTNGGVNHSQVGAGGPEGPCVSCHLPGASHTLDAAAGGYALCNGCHQGDGLVSDAFLAQQSAQFNATLKALGAALAQRGLSPNLDGNGVLKYPAFTARNWGNRLSGPLTMGAAFNYNLLAHDPGAFAHNPTYTKRLLRDSLDYLANGGVDRSRDLTATVTALLTNGGEQASAAAFLANAGNGSAACAVCHGAASDPLTGDNILADYNASKHARVAGGAACVSCHAAGGTAAHPPAAMLSANADLSAQCLHCHPVHSWPSAGICISCHNGHKPEQVKLPFPHFNNFSTAQFVTTNITCDNCHTALDSSGNRSFNIYSANLQWGRTGKANAVSPSWTGYDFKTMGSAAPATPANSAGNDCVRCHTTTGYVNYVSSGFTDIHAWGGSGLTAGGDRTREMVACSACHNPTPFNSFDSEELDEFFNPVQPAFSRRSVPPVTAYYNYSAPGAPKVLSSAPFADLGISNNCVACHSGTRSGNNLKQIAGKVGAAGSFWSNTRFIDPHGMGGAGILYGQTGYTYAATRTRNYTPPGNFMHPNIDSIANGGQGPCVACHLYTDKPHLFSPVSSASNGTIAKVTAYEEVCSGCHNGGVEPIDLNNPANLDAKKQGFLSSLKALSAALAAKGIYFNPQLSPYFFNVSDPALQGPGATCYTNWNALYSPAKPTVYTGEDVMGAAFNLRLLWSERGAYAHNDYYARRLIYDSIDFIDDGTLNSTVYMTIQNLTLSTSFTQDDKNRALSYIGSRP